MSAIALLGLPEELLSQIIGHVTLDGGVCTLAQVCGLLNGLSEALLYRSVSLTSYRPGLIHSEPARHADFKGFLRAIHSRPARLLHVRELDAALELRVELGLCHACELFESLPKMPHLNALRLQIVGGPRPSDLRSLEQSMIWGCTYERGRSALWKFFRMDAGQVELPVRGFHALRNLRSLKISFPRDLRSLPTDLVAYSALSHPFLRKLELENVASASVAPPQLPVSCTALTHLSMRRCQFTLPAYRSICAVPRALVHFEYVALGSVDSLDGEGLGEALSRHSDTLESLILQPNTVAPHRMDLSSLGRLSHLKLRNPYFDEDQGVSIGTHPGPLAMPTIFPPFLESLTLQNFHHSEKDYTLMFLLRCLTDPTQSGLRHLKLLKLETHASDEREFLPGGANTYTRVGERFCLKQSVGRIGMAAPSGMEGEVRDILAVEQGIIHIEWT